MENLKSKDLRLYVDDLPVLVLYKEVKFMKNSVKVFRQEMKKKFPQAIITDKALRYLKLLKTVKGKKMVKKEILTKIE